MQLSPHRGIVPRQFTGLVFASISLWITMCAAILTASLWAIIANRRFIYGDPASGPGRESG